MKSKSFFDIRETPLAKGISLAQQRLDADWSEAALSNFCCLSPGVMEEMEQGDLTPVTIALGASP